MDSGLLNQAKELVIELSIKYGCINSFFAKCMYDEFFNVLQHGGNDEMKEFIKDLIKCNKANSCYNVVMKEMFEKILKGVE